MFSTGQKLICVVRQKKNLHGCQFCTVYVLGLQGCTTACRIRWPRGPGAGPPAPAQRSIERICRDLSAHLQVFLCISLHIFPRVEMTEVLADVLEMRWGLRGQGLTELLRITPDLSNILLCLSGQFPFRFSIVSWLS